MKVSKTHIQVLSTPPNVRKVVETLANEYIMWMPEA